MGNDSGAPLDWGRDSIESRGRERRIIDHTSRLPSFYLRSGLRERDQEIKKRGAFHRRKENVCRT